MILVEAVPDPATAGDLDLPLIKFLAPNFSGHQFSTEPMVTVRLRCPWRRARFREIARRPREAGLNGRDIAKVLEVSPQRVSQLLKTGS